MEHRALKIAGRLSFLGNTHRARLDCLTESLKNEANLNAVGRVATVKSIVGMLVNRLCMEETFGAAEPAQLFCKSCCRPILPRGPCLCGRVCFPLWFLTSILTAGASRPEKPQRYSMFD